MLDRDTFHTVVTSTPLVSVEFIVKKEEQVLLGKRVNPPAEGYYFTIGGKVFKNETIEDALRRIAREELNLELTEHPTCIGVYEHIYEDGIFEDTGTHYLNLGFELQVDELPDLPMEQHSEYKWFSKSELLESREVHPYAKAYFQKQHICQTK